MRTLSVHILFSLIALIIAACCSTCVHSFWCFGHGLVAQIALNNVEPHVRDMTNKYFAYLGQIGPFPEVTDAVSGACWADDLKNPYGIHGMDGLHFRDQGYFVDNATVQEGFCLIQDDNLVSTMGSFFSAVSKNNQKNPWSTSFALAYLVHNYGDIHQPLHTVSMVTKDLPKGDFGGNLIKITWKDESKPNLHKFWDSLCYQPQFSDLIRPLNSTSQKFMYDTAVQFNETWNNISWEEGTLHDAEKIAQASYEVAIKEVYADLIVGPNNISIDGGVVPEWYQKRCIPVIERQVVLGGIRLAHTLTKLFKDAPMPTFPSVNANAAAPSTQTFGGRETGIFFGGFAAALFVIAASWFVYFFVWKNESVLPKTARGGPAVGDTAPLVSSSHGGNGGEPTSGNTGNHGAVDSQEIRNSLYTEAS